MLYKDKKRGKLHCLQDGKQIMSLIVGNHRLFADAEF